MIVNSKRTAVPHLQPVHSNPLHVRRKANFQNPANRFRSSSGMETYMTSGPLDLGEVTGAEGAVAV